jgi:condensation domain-containing protein
LPAEIRGEGRVEPITEKPAFWSEPIRSATPCEMSFWLFRGVGISRPTHVQRVLSFLGPLDLSSLIASLQKLVATEQSLGTVFIAPTNGSVQELKCAWRDFRDHCAIAPEYPLSGMDEADLTRIQEEELDYSFDLEKGPLFRFRLVRIEPRHHALFITLNHLIADAVTLRLVVARLVKYYPGFRQPEHPPSVTENPPLQLNAFAQWVEKRLDRSSLAGVSYWKGFTYPLVPFSGLRRARTQGSPRGPDSIWKMSMECDLKGFSTSKGLADSTAPLAALFLTIGVFSGIDRITLFTLSSLRILPVFRSISGLLTNILPISAHMDPNQPIADFLRNLDAMLILNAKHAFFPVSATYPAGATRMPGKDAVDLEDGNSRIALNFFGPVSGPESGIAAPHGPLIRGMNLPGSGTYRRPYEIILAFSYDTERIHLHWRYWNSRYDTARMREISDCYGSVLSAIVYGTLRSLGDALSIGALGADARIE